MKLAEEGLKKAEVGGKETELYVISLRNLLHVHTNNLNISKASELAAEADLLGLAERVFGADSRQLLSCVITMTMISLKARDFAKAHELAERSLVLAGHVDGNQDMEASH